MVADKGNTNSDITNNTTSKHKSKKEIKQYTRKHKLPIGIKSA